MTDKIAEHYRLSDVDIVDLLINSESVGLKHQYVNCVDFGI